MRNFKQYFSNALSLLLLGSAIFFAQALSGQDVIMIEGGAGNAGLLESTINGDTIAGGGRANPQRIYMLKKDQIHFMNSRIQFDGDSPTDSTSTLRIHGEEGGKKPIVVMSPLQGGNAFRSVVQGNLSLKNIYWSAKALNNSSSGLFEQLGNEKTLRIDGCVTEFAEGGDLFVMRQVRGPADIFITNSYFRDVSQFENSFNFAVVARGDNGEPIDSIWIQNTTVANSGLTFFGKLNPTNFAFFDHNTIVNTPKYVLFFDQFKESYFTNNLFVNCNWEGECQSTYETQLADGVPSGIINLDTIDAGLWQPGHGFVPEMADVKHLNSNNIHFTSPFLDKYYRGEFNDVGDFPISNRPWSPNVNEADLPIPVTNVPIQYINSKTQALIDEYRGIIASDNFNNTLDPMMVTKGIASQEVGDLFAKVARRNYGVAEPGEMVTEADKLILAFGDRDPQTFPGTEIEDSQDASDIGVAKVSDFVEDFSYTADTRSEIDNLPIGSLLWWDDANYDEDGALATVKTFYQDEITSVEDLSVFASTYKVKAYPNPLSDITRIDFELEKSSTAKLAIYDAVGRQIEVLTNRQLSAGAHSFKWNATERAGGIYYYVITLDGVSATGKLIVE